MDRFIRIGVYKILRKLGAQRENIDLNIKLNQLIELDDQDWNILMFFLESKFDIFIGKEQEKGLTTVEDIIETVRLNLNKTVGLNNRVYQQDLMLA